MRKQGLDRLWGRGIVWVRRQPYLATAIAFVIASHLAAVLWAVIATTSAQTPPPKISMQVRTIEPPPASRPIAAAQQQQPTSVKPSSAPPKPAPPKAKAEKAPEPVAAKKAPEKKSPAEKAPADKVAKGAPKAPAKAPPKKAAPPAAPRSHAKEEALLDELDKGLRALAALPSENTATSVSRKAVPLSIDEPLPAVASASAGRAATSTVAGYGEELVARLRLLLRLPEYGDVRVRLSLQRNGHVREIAIVSAESVRNRDYVEKTIPAIVFPSFGSHFDGEEVHTFTLTLSNDM